MNFYKGSSPRQEDIGSDRDVIRELHYKIFPQILETKNSQKNSYLSIIAPPQEGKSTLLLRFAKELVNNKEIVLWADAYKFVQQNPFNELKLIRRRRKKRIFAIIDNIARLSRYSDLLHDLARQTEIKVTLIGASRIKDWENVKFEHPLGIEYLFEKPGSRPRLPYKLEITKADVESAVKKLYDKGVLKAQKKPLRVPTNFSILIWALAAPEGEEDFSMKVLEEADDLSLLEKKAYCYICALHRFGLPMPSPLIKRLIGKDDIGYLEDLGKKGVIRYIDKIDSYISRHEIVAETIFRDFCPQIAFSKLFKLYKNILEKATLKEEMMIVLLFQTRLERDLSFKLKDELREKYQKTFSKSRSAELQGLGWGPFFYELSYQDLAKKAYKRALDIRKNFPEVHNNYAVFLSEMRKNQEAEEHYQRALELKEDFPAAHINYAVLLGEMERHQEQEEHYQRALELKEDFPEAHYNYALLLSGMGRHLEAEEHYQSALQLKQDYPAAHINYAFLLLGMGRHHDAEGHYKRALELKEDDPEPHNNYANLLDKMGRHREAEEHYQSALELKEDYPAAHVNYASLLDGMGKYSAAEEHYQRALELKEDFPEAHNNYALFLYKMQRYQEAEGHYQRALELKQDYPEAHNNYASLLHNMGKHKEAEEHYQRALELKEDYPAAHNNYALLLSVMGRHREAEEHFQRALELKEDHPGAHINYAVLLKDMGRNREAEEHYQRALELKEDYPEAMANLGFLYLKDDFKQLKKAVHWLNKAWEYREKLPDKGEMVKEALKALSSEKKKKK